MTIKWPIDLRNFDDVSNTISISSEECVVNFLAASSARRPLPRGRGTYFLLSGATLAHDLGFLIKASRADNWQFQPTFEQLPWLLAEHCDLCVHKEHATRVVPVAKSVFEQGKAYYERNKNLITRKYSREYIAIWDNKVLDHDTSFSSLAERVYKKLGYVSIYMPFVTSKQRVLRFESPKYRRSATGVS